MSSFPADREAFSTADDGDVRRMFERVTAAITATGRTIESVSAFQDDVLGEVRRQAEELALLRDDLRALANRQESLATAVRAAGVVVRAIKPECLRADEGDPRDA